MDMALVITRPCVLRRNGPRDGGTVRFFQRIEHGRAQGVGGRDPH